jgi:outer membrane protein assembly factor BamE
MWLRSAIIPRLQHLSTTMAAFHRTAVVNARNSMRVVLSLIALLLVSACTWLTPHKIEIQQGNYISREAFDRVKIGMTKSEVRTALGTPLLQDVFHANRWDYYFSHDRYGGFAKMARVNEQRRLTFLFENDKLTKIEGDANALPSEKIEAKK